MSQARSSSLYTSLGLVTLVLWSTTLPIARVLTEDLGYFTTGFCIYFGGGLLTCGFSALRAGELTKMWNLPRKYLFLCGSLFVSFFTLFYFALGTAANRQQSVIVGMLNYLWPALTLVLSVPILGKRPHWTLLPGILLALSGIVLAIAQNSGLSFAQIPELIQANGLSYLSAGLGAVTWALFTNFSKKLNPPSGATPLFLLATGLVMGVLAFSHPVEAHWSSRSFWGLVFIIIFPVSMGYSFWERGARHGNIILLSTLAYFVPLASVIWCAIYFQLQIPAGVWLGCVLVILGALLCQYSFKEPSAAS